MRKQTITGVAAVGAALALGAAPAALAERPADPGSQGQGHAKSGGQGKEKSGGKANGGGKTVMYVFKGTYDGASGVQVTKGNAHVKRAELVGTLVSFDLASAKFSVGDVDASGTADLADVATGDKVVVKARLPREEPGVQPYIAKQLVDQTNPATD
jgi:hypothetical protein